MKRSIILLDTETADLTGSVYDIGYVITDKAGKIRQERNWLVSEIFTDAKKMMGAFYARKLFTHYAPMLERGAITLTPWEQIVATIQDDCEVFDVNTVAAYNLAFDRRVLKSTHNMLGHTGKILPHKMDQLCIWRFACETKLNSALYKKLARDLGWITSAGNIKTGAENAYRFCAGDWGFIEEHTALSDALIENEILRSCFATKKTIPYNKVKDKYSTHPWRIVNGK